MKIENFFNIAWNPPVYIAVIAVFASFYIFRILSRQLPKNQEKLQYLAVGINSGKLESVRQMVIDSALSDARKNWIFINVLDEVQSQIDISVDSRRRALRLMIIVRTVPLFTSLLTALAAQLDIIRAPSLFLVNVFMMLTSMAIELGRTSRHYNFWAYSRETANRLYGTINRYLAEDDLDDKFKSLVSEIDKIGIAYDNSINTLIAMDLETSMSDDAEGKEPGDAPAPKPGKNCDENSRNGKSNAKQNQIIAIDRKPVQDPDGC